MKTKSSKVKFFAVCIFLLAVFASVPVSATDITEVTPTLPDPFPEFRIGDSLVDSYRPGTIDDISTYVDEINEDLNLNLSPDEINQYAVILASRYLTATEKVSPNSSINVNNYSKFQQDVIDVLGLNLIKRNNYLQLTSGSEPFCDTPRIMKLTSVDTSSMRNDNYVSPSSQSAPYAYGDLLYLCIFVDFEGDPSGAWTTADRNAALNKVQSGTAVMTNRAPSSANIDRMYRYYSTTVSGDGDQKDSTTWGDSGWMEEAAANLGYTSSSYPTSTEYMANYLIDLYDRDSIVVIYCIHDRGRSYAVNPYYGYTDRCVVFFWKESDNTYNEQADKNVYAHETLHLYGALDEYPTEPSTDGITSYMAVSPLNQWYTNTNHHNNTNHQHSIMCAEGLYGVNNPVISQSTKNFIGWGDKDNDGIIDALEIRAGTT